jgi:hypothetical protein
MRWAKLEFTCICFKKLNLLIAALNLHHPFVPPESTAWIFFIFWPVRFTSVQLVSSPPFPIPSAASPLADVVTPPRRVTLPSYSAKMSSLPLLHLLTKLCPIASPLEPKLKHWIRSTVVGYPLWTAWLPPSTTVKRSSISTLVTLPTTQLHLHFASSLA